MSKKGVVPPQFAKYLKQKAAKKSAKPMKK